MVGGSKMRKVAKRMTWLPPCGGCCSLSPTQQRQDDQVKRTSSPAPSSSSSPKMHNVAAAETDERLFLTQTSLCAICLEALNCSGGDKAKQAIFTSQCCHAFHFTCISSNVRHGSITCPICRAHWTQLPRSSSSSSSSTDPILRILDDSIATFRVHRRSLLGSTCYNDDEPLQHGGDSDQNHQNRLNFTLHLHSQQHETAAAAAFLSVKLAQQEPTDLVLVASSQQRLVLVKQCMALVVFSLRSIDRLAIVTCSSTTATRALPLRRMTCHGKRTALQVIDRLVFHTSDNASNAEPGLKKGMKILQDRTHRNPHSRILHLISDTSSSTPPPTLVPPHVVVQFGFHEMWRDAGFVMHKFEGFLARALGGVIRDTCLRIGEDGEVVRLGELRGGEERRIALNLNDETESVSVVYSYIQQGVGGAQCMTTGEIQVSLQDSKWETNSNNSGLGPYMLGRSSNVESWEYHDPYMARRWAKHLHAYNP